MKKLIQSFALLASLSIGFSSCSQTGCPTFSQEIQFDKDLKANELLVSTELLDDGLN